MKIAHFNLVFDRKKLATNIKTGLIQIECYRKGGSRVYVSTDVKVLYNQWNDKKKMVNEKHPNAFELNRTLKKMLDDFQKFEAKQYEKGITVPLQFYKSFKQSESNYTSFWNFTNLNLKITQVSVKTPRRITGLG